MFNTLFLMSKITLRYLLKCLIKLFLTLFSIHVIIISASYARIPVIPSLDILLMFNLLKILSLNFLIFLFVCVTVCFDLTIDINVKMYLIMSLSKRILLLLFSKESIVYNFAK